jgi:hypothetical protein
MCIANVAYKKPTAYDSKRTKNLLRYLTYRDGRDDHIKQVSGMERWVDHGLGGSVAEIEQDVADRDLLPGSHLVDSGYVVAELLVNGPRKHQIDVVGPPLGSSSRQHRENLGYDLNAFVIDWEARDSVG